MIRLAARDLSLRVGARTLIASLTLAFEAGQNWAILGANGSGKSTLLRALAGLRRPDGGEVRLDDIGIAEHPRRQRARTLGLLFQDTPSAFPATVYETVLSGRHPHLDFWQSEGPADQAAAQSALAAVDLPGLAARTLDSLSGGERRRVELATLLAQDPAVCLLDEPVNHLDPHQQIALLRLMTRRVERPGHVNILVLHDVNLALRFCTHGLMLLADGQCRHGPLATLIDREALAAVYRCPMREIQAGSERYFFPD